MTPRFEGLEDWLGDNAINQLGNLGYSSYLLLITNHPKI